MKPQKDPRFNTSIAAKIRERGTFNWLKAVVTNLSRSGAGITMQSPFPPTTIVEVEIRTSSTGLGVHKQNLVGEIVWQRGLKCGVRFSGKKTPTAKT